ncbi:MAG TPA: helix-turn-helix domain-containing protein [Candidatus Polarisedimenticolia bacterium]|nr:helix-turn-helix domain-containing protein [Candidatus Polarisedimenticolia bacterium]
MTLLTIREASQLIGRTPATVRRYIRSGRLRAEKEAGKFGEEYKIRREDLLALGFSPSTLPATIPDEVVASQPVPTVAQEGVPVALFNELLMKHEQILVQYGMIRAGGQKLLEYKADAEAKDEALQAAEERYQAIRVRASKEIRFLRKHLREAEIEIEERNIEIVLLQEKIRRLEMAAAGAAAAVDSFDARVIEIRQKERAIAHLEVPQGGGPTSAPTSFTSSEHWLERFPPAERKEDH